MAERPILFSAPMVRAILDGTKSQTRRLFKHQPDEHHWQAIPEYRLERSEMVTIDGRRAVKFAHSIPHNPVSDDASRWICCPYGAPSDRLWVRETWAPTGEPGRALYRSDFPDGPLSIKFRPSIHMPRRFSRITLEVADVRVERLQGISYEDLAAEGIQEIIDAGVDHDGWPRDAYRSLWESINGAGSWDENPWVWVIEFRRIDPEPHHG